ncbi:MAG: hypothetical protein DSM107014_11310 [Gomphosphaeria aponina SAG 52.96 = DSM 107014]|uniref:Uncharacterized protein n=1 Tax=Gomphosphaeria aponina SAG 52.96 = DSM 107014 TaxID=1521640 RepID=A0A941GUD1_9CHRO|nr:hypothetical protein [Gomphosphaeria aponina SAG 52.96 = DSM 107014]
MSQIINLKLNNKIFTAIQQQAEAMGTSPEILAASILEKQFEQVFSETLDEGEREVARTKFEEHFGEINLSHTIDVNNESIDADLAREYVNNHEEA